LESVQATASGYWTPGIRDNVIGGLWTAALIGMLGLTMGSSIVKAMIDAAVEKHLNRVLESNPPKGVNTSG
jgi:hypothetical protein